MCYYKFGSGPGSGDMILAIRDLFRPCRRWAMQVGLWERSTEQGKEERCVPKNAMVSFCYRCHPQSQLMKWSLVGRHHLASGFLIESQGRNSHCFFDLAALLLVRKVMHS